MGRSQRGTTHIIGLAIMLILLPLLLVVSFISSHFLLLAIAGIIIAYRVGVARERNRQLIMRTGEARTHSNITQLREPDTGEDTAPHRWPDGTSVNMGPVPDWLRPNESVTDESEEARERLVEDPRSGVHDIWRKRRP